MKMFPSSPNYLIYLGNAQTISRVYTPLESIGIAISDPGEHFIEAGISGGSILEPNYCNKPWWAIEIIEIE